MNIEITSAKLNSIYENLNSLTRKGQISKLEVFNVEHNENFIKFVFRKDIGRKGAWQPITSLKVTHIDDEDPGL
jgi:hypothetical protein